MGTGLGTQVGLRDDDDISWVRALLMEQLHVVYTGLHVPLSRSFFEVLHWKVVVLHRVAILTTGTAPSIGASGGEGQCRVVPQRGNQVEVVLPGHL